MTFYQQIIHGIHIPAAVRIAQQAIDISGRVCTQHDPFAEQIVNTVDGAVQVDIAEVFRDIFRLCGGTSADKYLGAENEIEALSIFEFQLYIPCGKGRSAICSLPDKRTLFGERKRADKIKIGAVVGGIKLYILRKPDPVFPADIKLRRDICQRIIAPAKVDTGKERSVRLNSGNMEGVPFGTEIGCGKDAVRQLPAAN